jgi:hypothetical protein
MGFISGIKYNFQGNLSKTYPLTSWLRQQSALHGMSILRPYFQASWNMPSTAANGSFQTSLCIRAALYAYALFSPHSVHKVRTAR